MFPDCGDFRHVLPSLAWYHYSSCVSNYRYLCLCSSLWPSQFIQCLTHGWHLIKQRLDELRVFSSKTSTKTESRYWQSEEDVRILDPHASKGNVKQRSNFVKWATQSRHDDSGDRAQVCKEEWNLCTHKNLLKDVHHSTVPAASKLKKPKSHQWWAERRHGLSIWWNILFNRKAWSTNAWYYIAWWLILIFNLIELIKGQRQS